eukprot:scaffold203732_cov50-Cyclotella_meneghiniana.AAC.1
MKPKVDSDEPSQTGPDMSDERSEGCMDITIQWIQECVALGTKVFRCGCVPGNFSVVRQF